MKQNKPQYNLRNTLKKGKRKITSQVKPLVYSTGKLLFRQNVGVPLTSATVKIGKITQLVH